MRKLKLQQNAKAADTAQKAKDVENEGKTVNVLDAGAYGDIGDSAQQKVTVHLRKKWDARDAGTEHDEQPVESEYQDFTAAYSSYREPSATGTFVYNQLTGPAGSLPAGVNPKLRERYLDDAELCTVFGVSSRAQFDALPKWRRDKLKQQKQLFN